MSRFLCCGGSASAVNEARPFATDTSRFYKPAGMPTAASVPQPADGERGEDVFRMVKISVQHISPSHDYESSSEGEVDFPGILLEEAEAEDDEDDDVYEAAMAALSNKQAQNSRESSPKRSAASVVKSPSAASTIPASVVAGVGGGAAKAESEEASAKGSLPARRKPRLLIKRLGVLKLHLLDDGVWGEVCSYVGAPMDRFEIMAITGDDLELNSKSYIMKRRNLSSHRLPEYTRVGRLLLRERSFSPFYDTHSRYNTIFKFEIQPTDPHDLSYMEGWYSSRIFCEELTGSVV